MYQSVNLIFGGFLKFVPPVRRGAAGGARLVQEQPALLGN